MSKCSSGQWTFPIPIQFCLAQQTTKIARGGARALPLPSPRFIVCWVPPPRHTHTRKHSGRAGIAQRGTAAVQPACTLKTRVRVLLRRQAEEDYEEEMRHPADAGTGDGARRCRCAVLGVSLFRVLSQTYKMNIHGGGGREEAGVGEPDFRRVLRSVVERLRSRPPP